MNMKTSVLGIERREHPFKYKLTLNKLIMNTIKSYIILMYTVQDCLHICCACVQILNINGSVLSEGHTEYFYN